MKEVSCRVLDVHFRELKKRGIRPELWVDGVSVPIARLQNKHERIDWQDFATLMANLQRFWTPEEIRAQGASWIESPFLRYARLLAGALFTPKEFYRWLASGTKKSKKGGGSQMHDCTTTEFADLGPDHLSLDVRIDPGYCECPEFFWLLEGGFSVAPQMFGKPRAEIRRVPIERGVRFEVRLPTGSDRVSRLRRAYNWLTSSRAVASELDDAITKLQANYSEIEAQRAKLAAQAAQLETAHIVNGLIQENLDLDLTASTITAALVEHAGFARAELRIDCEVEGLRIDRNFVHGDGGARTAHALSGRVANTGELVVWAHATADPTEREGLLSFIVPGIAMALDNAISYLVMDEYRRGLEVRVEQRTAELRQAKEARDRIFANINHDIRSPLSLILLAVSEARRNGVSTPASEKTLSAIEHGARRVLRMVDELLILAEGRENDVEVARVRCDLGRLAAAVGEAWRPAAASASLTLAHECSEGMIVLADPNALERILANLVSNAIKFTPKGGRVTVRVAAEDGRAVLDVADDGHGIDDDLKTRLFGRFERGAGVRKAAIGGSGLGLSLVKELAEAFEGSVGVFDTPGGGATFRVELPLAGGEGGHTSRRPRMRAGDFGMSVGPAEPTIYESRGGSVRATILLAEDDPALRDHTATLLSEHYRVIAAPDGAAALALAKEQQPDLLITDIQMPNMDGIELTKRFRAIPNNRMAPVLVLTTFADIEDKLAGFEAGAIDHIAKPFEPEELRARVRSQLAIRSLALQLLETEKLAALGTLSAGLAHEIRNPANGIVNAIAPLRELLPPEAIEPGSPAAELLDVLEHCSNQVGALSRELLGFKRGAPLKRAGIPLDTLIRRVKTTMQHTLDGVLVREQLEYKGPIRCAEPLFAQVLTNLIENGAHAAGRGGWVEIRSGLDEQRVYLEVTDSGPGVPDHLRERIFEPFFTTKPAGAGTGLGLSTARDIALRHGGTLDVRPRPGPERGSVFRLTLPLES